MELRPSRVASAEKVRKLVDSAFATRYYDLELTLKTASKAVVLAEEVRSELPADLIVAAWTEYGNALRIAGRYPESERALERASAETTSDPHTKSHLLEVTASLHRNTRRFESAARLLLSAIDIHQSIGDSDGEARHYNHLGMVYMDSGDAPRALCAFQLSLKLFGPDASIDVVTMAGHNLLEAMVVDGRLSGAASGLALLEPLYRRTTSARLAAKTEWLRARLCRALKQPSAARLAYERAYALLLNEPRAPELPELRSEMAELEEAVGSSASSGEPG